MGDVKKLIIDLKNKVAPVTGGSRGLGKNSAFRLAEKGSDVIIIYYQQAETADAVVKEIEKHYQRNENGCVVNISSGLTRFSLPDIARRMVKEYGMSSKVSQVYFAREKIEGTELRELVAEAQDYFSKKTGKH